MPKVKKAKHVNLGGRPVAVHRFFRGLPVVDATEPLRIILSQEDIKKGKRLDPNNCAFAQACRRLFNSHAVLFLRRTAYVELPDRKNNRLVNKFDITPAVHKIIANFDKTGEAPEGGFTLSPPPPSRTVEAHREYRRKYSADVYYGRRSPKKGQRKSNAKYLKTMEGVRDGRGKLGINYSY